MSERELPPVTALAMTSLALIIVGGIYLASYLPRQVPLMPAELLLGASVVLLAVNLALLARVRGFAWARFFEIGRWALLGYAVIAALIEFAFVRDGISGGPLVVLTLSIIVYAVHVPLLIAFTVARFADSEVPVP